VLHKKRYTNNLAV